MSELGMARGQRSRAPEIFLFSTSLHSVEALSSALLAQNYAVTAFLDVCSFLATARVRDPDAIVIDVAEEDRSGADLINKLCPGLCAAPVLICAKDDIPPALPGCEEACAVTILPTPVTPDLVIGRIRDMLPRPPEVDAGAGDSRDYIVPKGWGIEHGLTRRERDVLQQIVGGLSSKEAARELGISPRTVEVHRSHLLSKLGAKNVADLVRLTLARRERN